MGKKEKKISQELAIKSYYQSTRDGNFLDQNQFSKYAFEFFLSTLLFREDLSRVVYSKEDIAFRRRVETNGNGDVKGEAFSYLNLNLPFAVYSQEGSFEEDDRGATQNAGQIVAGYPNPDTGIITKAAAVKVKYTATAFFARRDDVNIASQLLYWESTPKFPVYYVVQHLLAGHPIDIPVFMSLDSFDSNPNYQEKDWLTSSKIFPIKMEFTIRSYQTLIETIDDTIQLPIRFSGLYGYNNKEIVFTEKTSLIWADVKWTPEAAKRAMEESVHKDSDGYIIHTPQDIGVRQSRIETVDPEIDDFIDREFTSEIVNDTVADAIKGYFSDDREVILDEFHQHDELTNENAITIEWKIKETDMPNFKSLVIYIPGIIHRAIDDVHQTQFEITGLHPGSEYDCTLIVLSKNNTKLTYKLNLKTKGEKVLGKKLMDHLIGRVFTMRD